MSRFKLFIPLIVFAVLAGFFWKGLSLDPTHMPSALLDKPVPTFSLVTVNDPQKQVSQEDLKGRVSLLNVWATWCISCRQEHPFLLDIAEKGTPIYGVNYKDDVEMARKWLKDLEDPYQFSIVDADGRLGIDLGVFGAPETYIVDKTGVIRYKHVGVVTDKVWQETLQPIVQSLQ
ncbi:DsbE family thiol:disulfide interchange protein [Maricurvus nonylphenolicus]|uniref:DsbE family thiol:disulfide interchange protein n=1 Tax=Maricurvus nonylphenolicus TaxID=1008307 RepID=UPI0036F203EE